MAFIVHGAPLLHVARMPRARACTVTCSSTGAFETGDSSNNSNNNNDDDDDKKRRISSQGVQKGESSCMSAHSLRSELSAVDMEYLRKVRERLGRSGSRSGVDGESRVSNSWLTEQSRLQGGVFNASTAALRAGVSEFRRGAYASAAEFFRVAAETGGDTDGSASLWLAQALDASGEKRSAVAVLGRLKTHDRVRVRKTACELEFILKAPRLDVDRREFVDIPMFECFGHSDKGMLTSPYVTKGLKLPRKRRPKKPEKYSLEWYMAKKPPPRTSAHASNDWLVLAALAAGTTALLIGAVPW